MSIDPSLTDWSSQPPHITSNDGTSLPPFRSIPTDHHAHVSTIYPLATSQYR